MSIKVLSAHSPGLFQSPYLDRTLRVLWVERIGIQRLLRFDFQHQSNLPMLGSKEYLSSCIFKVPLPFTLSGDDHEVDTKQNCHVSLYSIIASYTPPDLRNEDQRSYRPANLCKAALRGKKSLVGLIFPQPVGSAQT